MASFLETVTLGSSREQVVIDKTTPIKPGDVFLHKYKQACFVCYAVGEKNLIVQNNDVMVTGGQEFSCYAKADCIRVVPLEMLINKFNNLTAAAVEADDRPSLGK